MNREHDIHVNNKRVLRICQHDRFQSTIKYSTNSVTKQPDQPYHTAENILDREFSNEASNQSGLTDVMEFKYNEGKELEELINGEKSMIIRGSAGKKSPLGGRAKENDILYFVEKGGNMEITHRGLLTKVIEKYKMTPEESTEFIEGFGQELNLSEKQKTRWYGKKCIGLYEVSHLEKIEPFYYDREKNMDDWIITDNLEDIQL